MRYLAILIATSVLAACSTTPVTPKTKAVSLPQPLAAELQKTSMVSAMQFLLTAAATDFRTRRPSDPGRFRDVRIGHVMAPDGSEQYMLCGQFLSEQEKGKAEWMPFTTIKTSGYEQLIGSQAAGLCQSTSIIWEKEGDLSPLLQSRFDSLR